MHTRTALTLVLALCPWIVPTIASAISNASSGADNGYGPTNRGAWRDGFDIFSDYTNNLVVPPGKLVEVDRPFLVLVE
jgi:hypothetical protein